MHEGGSARLIHKIDVKALAGRECDAGVSVRPDEAEYFDRFAVNDESSGAGSQAKRSGAGFGAAAARCVCRKLDSAILMVKATKDRS